LVLVVYAILTMETLMRTSSKRIGLSALSLLFTGVPISFGGEGLIAPVWMKEVKPGSHELRIRRSEMDVYVETGKTLTLSYFKGSFIVVPEERKELAPEPGKMAEGTKRVRPRDEAKPTDLTPWERFLNGTSPTF